MTDVARRPFVAADALSVAYPRYGVEWTLVASPTCTRIGDATNLTAAVGELSAPVANDFDGVYPYSAITQVTDALGNVFIRIPKFYIRKTVGIALNRIEISRTKYPGFYLPECFYDFTNSRELPYFDFGKHKASLEAGNKLGSKPGVFPLVSKNIVEFRGYAQANGAGYQQLDIHAHDVLSALFTVEYATLNSQAILNGFTTGAWDVTHTATAAENAVNRIIVTNAVAGAYRVGQSIGIGTSLGGQEIATNRLVTSITVFDASNKAIAFDGAAVNVAIGNSVYSTGWKNGIVSGPVSGYLTANDGKYPCAYRGIESPWGDVWQFVDGININERQAWVASNAANYASNVFAAPYTQLGYVNGALDGWAKTLGFDAANPFAQLPVAVGGGSTTYLADYYYQSAGQRIARVGGAWNYGSGAGLRCWSADGVSSLAFVSFGGRLLRKAT